MRRQDVRLTAMPPRLSRAAGPATGSSQHDLRPQPVPVRGLGPRARFFKTLRSPALSMTGTARHRSMAPSGILTWIWPAPRAGDHNGRSPRGTIRSMAAIPQSTRDSITLRLLDHAEAHWPQLTRVQVTYRGAFGYVTGVLRDGHHSRSAGCATAA
jgi:hypothetical protein